MLNVQPVRLRFIFGCLLVSVLSLCKGLRKDSSFKYTMHPRCRMNSNPQRILDTPAVLFCLTPCIYLRRAGVVDLIPPYLISGKRYVKTAPVSTKHGRCLRFVRIVHDTVFTVFDVSVDFNITV